MGLKQAWHALIGKTATDNSSDKPRDPRNNYTFSQEDTEMSLEMRRLRQEIKLTKEKMLLLQQKRELEELKAEMYEEEDEDDDKDDISDMLMQLVSTIKGGQSLSVNPTPQTAEIQSTLQTAPSSNPTLSDDEIRDFIEKQDKKYIKLAKNMPKPMVLEMAVNKLGLSRQDAERAHKILMEEY